MIANSGAVVEAGPDGGPRYLRLSSVAPLLLRPTAVGLYLVGGAAGPLAGDRVSLDLRVGAGCHLTVRSVAAAVARPGPSRAGWSRLIVTIDIGAGATLHWLPEPSVASEGCRHSVEAAIRMGAGAGLVWREEVVLGRHAEASGSWESALRVDIGGRALIRQHLALGPHAPGWDGQAVVGDARAVGSLLLVGPGVDPGPDVGLCRGVGDAGAGSARSTIMPLAGPGLLVSALAPTAIGLRATLNQSLARLVPEPTYHST